ncbi:hypothetical protein HUT16_00670 [Kitasatospora sp. NA04385]|uniref:hypothetical protein n=1 Tax=Kitasatospora sp. NA04385 TaxID=2742135 RepID=UPI0015917438|nr:hypothetical protein [Kitasatospora sp. NA04385]QKW17768.1 hypothetical protein HUT16_00670 [Kitasatospora sp. NA04385]
MVGATGVLRPAATALVRRGHRVSALARRPGPLADLARECGDALRPLAADVADPGLPEALDAARRAAGPFTGARLYRPDAPAGAVARLLRAVGAGGPAVLLLTSAWAAPDAGQPPFPAARRLLLGWAAGPGGPRWHTPEEISAGALARFDGPPGDAVLGAVRPWPERPA